MQIGSVVWEEFDHIHTYIHTYIHTEFGQCGSQYTRNAVYMCINLFLIFGIDLGVRVPVYTFTCTHFYSLVYIACLMFCVMCKL